MRNVCAHTDDVHDRLIIIVMMIVDTDVSKELLLLPKHICENLLFIDENVHGVAPAT